MEWVLKSVFCMIFLKFATKSNMKALIILSHSWSPFLLLTYLYGENELLWGPVPPFGAILQEKTPPVSRELIYYVTILQNYLCPI